MPTHRIQRLAHSGWWIIFRHDPPTPSLPSGRTVAVYVGRNYPDALWQRLQADA